MEQTLQSSADGCRGRDMVGAWRADDATTTSTSMRATLEGEADSVAFGG